MHRKPQGNRVFQCAVEGCGKVYTANNNLNYHVRKHHPENGLFLCSWCGRYFQGSEAHTEHQATHKAAQKEYRPGTLLSSPNHFSDSVHSRDNQTSSAVDHRVPAHYLSVFPIKFVDSEFHDRLRKIRGKTTASQFHSKDLRITDESGVPVEYQSVFPVTQATSRAGGWESSWGRPNCSTMEMAFPTATASFEVAAGLRSTASEFCKCACYLDRHEREKPLLLLEIDQLYLLAVSRSLSRRCSVYWYCYKSIVEHANDSTAAPRIRS